MIWYDMTWYDMTWCDVMWCDMYRSPGTDWISVRIRCSVSVSVSLSLSLSLTTMGAKPRERVLGLQDPLQSTPVNKTNHFKAIICHGLPSHDGYPYSARKKKHIYIYTHINGSSVLSFGRHVRNNDHKSMISFGKSLVASPNLQINHPVPWWSLKPISVAP